MKLPYAATLISTSIRLVVLVSETIVVAKEWVVMFRTIARMVREDYNAAKEPEDFG